MKTSPIPIPDNLPPALALALFELLHHLSDALWNHYETDLLKLIMAERDQVSSAQQTLDFNDDLPF